MTRTATPTKVVGWREGAVPLRSEVVYAVGCSAAAGEEAVVLGHVPTLAQAFEVAEMLVREHLAASCRAGEATAIGDALRDLQAEGPKSYGWWTDAAGYEIWYGPVTAAVPVGMAAGELALLATLHESPAGFAAAC